MRESLPARNTLVCVVVSSCLCSCLTHVTSRWLVVLLVVHRVRDGLRHVTACHLDLL